MVKLLTAFSLSVAAAIVPAQVLYAQSMAYSPANAIVKEKQELTVRFRVRATGQSYRSTYHELYSEHSWEHPQAFIVRIPKTVQGQLADAGISDAARHFYGHKIDATGVIEAVEFGDIKRYTLVIQRAQDIRRAPENQVTPTETYLRRDIAGFTVLLNPMVADQAPLLENVMDSIDMQISDMTGRLPAERLAELKQTFIWVELDDEADKAAVYHSSADWIVASAGNQDKIGHIEIVNASNFVNWSRDHQPSLLLHQYIHAFHHKVLGAAHQGIIDTYEQVQLRHMYDQLEHMSGAVSLGYATLSPFEYFAEISEAYFARNDYFPFNRAQLKVHDPIGHDLVEQLWLEKPVSDLPIVSK